MYGLNNKCLMLAMLVSDKGAHYKQLPKQMLMRLPGNALLQRAYNISAGIITWEACPLSH